MDVIRDFFLTDRFLLWKNAAAVLGAACVAVFAFKQLRLLHGAFHAYVMKPLTRKNLKKYGCWAGKLRMRRRSKCCGQLKTVRRRVISTC